MFDFEKLDVYKKAKDFHSEIRSFLRKEKVDAISANQLSRASLSIALNIAEGSGRFSSRDKKNFYIISRSSIFEWIAILDILKDEGVLSENDYGLFYEKAEELSKMLFAMIRNLN